MRTFVRKARAKNLKSNKKKHVSFRLIFILLKMQFLNILILLILFIQTKPVTSRRFFYSIELETTTHFPVVASTLRPHSSGINKFGEQVFVEHAPFNFKIKFHEKPKHDEMKEEKRQLETPGNFASKLLLRQKKQERGLTDTPIGQMFLKQMTEQCQFKECPIEKTWLDIEKMWSNLHDKMPLSKIYGQQEKKVKKMMKKLRKKRSNFDGFNIWHQWNEWVKKMHRKNCNLVDVEIDFDRIDDKLHETKPLANLYSDNYEKSKFNPCSLGLAVSQFFKALRTGVKWGQAF